MAYNFSEIEKKWQKFWEDNKTFEVKVDPSKPKYYVLDMFPYPSGAGLHVGHPLGYIASDIYTRYKRLQGFNVLHPMGYDAFGLPAEQYAIRTGQHPAITTDQNIKTYRKQMEVIGLSFDWSKEVRTCDPGYYKHTQSVFIDLYNHWYDPEKKQARPIEELEKKLKLEGGELEEELSNHRLAYLADVNVNWCPALGTVLANDEVKEGFSVRGNHPVEQKKMKQWCLRITAYSQRLLDGLEKIDWPEPLKEMQRNWIGRSEGAEVDFQVDDSDEKMRVFTTRPDTLFGVTFMVLAPESELVQALTSSEQKNKVEDYLKKTKSKSELERQSNVKEVSGVFTGSYCIHPFTKKKIPIWIADYVLGGYGTGAIMAVPAHDSRDYAFAKHFNLEIIPLIEGADVSEESLDAKEGKMCNSDFLDGLDVKDAITKAIEKIESEKLGERKINYRLRDAIFSRQRYWGEPFPVYYKDGKPHMLDKSELPLELPEVDAFLPTEDGDPPLGRAKNWQTKDGYPYEMSTMPGFAGSSAYFLRYMDPNNSEELVSKEANEYWQNVDFYVGGSEHATGHLLYSRFWNMFLYDMGKIVKEEPFQKLINQGMIQGRSNFVYRVKGTNKFVSKGLKNKFETHALHVDVNIVKNDELDTEAFKNWMPEYKDAEFELEDGKYICGHAQEKMSKSLYNVVNPDDVINEYGADALRLYEMFLGPVEFSKPWNTSGIEGVYRFLNKFWKLCYDESGKLCLEDKEETEEEQKAIHKTIKKIREDLENFSLNTAVSAFMICVNDLGKLKSNNKRVIEKLTIIMAPFTPHICEQVWSDLGHETSISFAEFPLHDEKYLKEDNYKYPISVNGKMKFLLELPLSFGKNDIEKEVMSNEKVKELIGDKKLKKLIIVPKKIVNLVL